LRAAARSGLAKIGREPRPFRWTLIGNLSDVTRAAGLLIGSVLLFSAGCVGASNTSPTGTAGDATFRVIGYVTDTGPMASEQQIRQLTHLNYAFALPQPNGTLLAIANPWKLEGYVTAAHQHGIKVLISVGGWGWDDEFEQLAALPESRARFVTEVTALVETFELDGADIDWEYPDPGGSSDAFTLLIRQLRASLPPGKLLTAAVAAVGPGADGVADDVFAFVDFLNLMAYDGDGPQHSPMSYAEESLAYWQGRGLPPGQSVLGVPFYSRPAEIPYRELIKADAGAADVDEIAYHTTQVNYNGLATMRRKTQLAMDEASGIMIWTVVDDTTDDTSLLGAIQAELAR
jgi:chitinase